MSTPNATGAMLRRLAPFAATLVLACAESAVAPAPVERAPAPPIAAATSLMRATVDVGAGTMTLEPVNPIASPLAGAVRGAIYGDQRVTVRVYNSPVITTASSVAGKKTYSANVGVQNLLPYAIGDEQSGPAPADTIGLHVFMNSGPTVIATSSPCTVACSVTVRNAQGTMAFTAPGQPYWHWPERIPAVGSVGGDTTLARRLWAFDADTQVTIFSFEVLVSAPWAAPNETRWKVDYQGDSLPDTQSEPRWRLMRVGNGGTYTATAGSLALQPGGSAEISFYRRDSVGVTQDAYLEARIQWNGNANQTSAFAEPQIILNDGVRMIAIGVYRNRVGFSAADGSLIGSSIPVSTGVFHTYQLRKYAADSAVFYVDGARGGALAYGGFSANPYGAAAPRIQFGAKNSQSGNSVFDYVVYELGAVQP